MVQGCGAYILSKEEIADEDSGGNAAKVGDQAAGYCVPGFLYAYGAEINGQHIEDGFGGALHNSNHF